MKRVLRWLLVLALMINIVGVAHAQPESPRAQPALLQLAKERPNEKVKIIVQRKAQEKIPPQALERAGGNVTRDLPIINGFAMEIPARAVEALAKSKGVRWISIDAPMRAADVTEGFGEEGFSEPSEDIRYVEDIAIQPDGKFVLIGSSVDVQDFSAIRYNTDGTRDLSFGTTGLVTTDISRNNDYAKAVAVQPDSKIVVAGEGYYGKRNGNNFIVVRYNSDGSLDSSFGSGGTVVTPVDRQSDDEVADMLLQPDGKIVVVGRVYNDTNCRIGLVRYLANGNLDQSFGTKGVAFAPINNCVSAGYNREVSALALQADGKLVVSGGEYNGIDYDILVTRFQANGALDTSFGNGGYVRTAVGAYHEWGQKVMVQPDDKIVVAGKLTTTSSTSNSSSNDTAVVRYLPDGSLDPAFGTDGKVIADYGMYDVSGLALQSTGKIVISMDYGYTYIRLLRLSADGARDYTFNGTGYAYYFSFRPAGSQAMTIQADDKIITSGYRFRYNNGASIYQSGLVRLTADGELNMGTSPYVRAVGATKLWAERPELLGDGVTVAVVDSGVNSHVELQTENNVTRIKRHVDFTGANDIYDHYGHGTHVAGIVGSNGATTGGQRIGMAPHVNLLNVKVSNGQGMSLMSDVVASLQWVFENKDTYNIRVVNLSLNSTVPESYHVNPLSAAAEILWFNGVTVVVAAGNNGTGNGPVDLLPPANDPFVITVGAVDSMGTTNISDDQVAFFSAYGTTIDGHQKPDMIAPGRNIVSLLANTSSWIYQNRTAHRLDSYLFRMSGTSMAAPVVSGAAALLLQDEPNLTPDQVKYRLMATANQSWAAYDPAKAGAGYLDIYAAVNGTTTANANTGILPSQMLFTGEDPVAWDSVSWNSVSWNSVSWNSVSWNSVSWNSDTWMTSIWDEEIVEAASMEEPMRPPDAIFAPTEEEQVNKLYLPVIQN